MVNNTGLNFSQIKVLLNLKEGDKVQEVWFNDQSELCALIEYDRGIRTEVAKSWGKDIIG